MNEGIDFTQIPLRDIHVPGDVPWWPPAPGWWMLIAFALGAALYAAYRYHALLRQRLALRALTQLQTALREGAEPARCLAQTSVVLLRFAMSVAPDRGRIAGLVGGRWLEYLDSCWDRGLFAGGSGRSLISAPYAPANRVSSREALELTELCIDWVRAQRIKRQGF